MKRAAMLYCADCDAPRFKVLASRDQLPFLTPDNVEHERRLPYTLEHAFFLRLTLDMIGADVRKNPLLTGIPASTAASVISNVAFFAREALEERVDDYWVGQMIVREEGSDSGPLEFSSWFIGPLAILQNRISEECETVSQETKQSVLRVNIVNAARASQFVRTRAEDLGLTDAQLRGCE